MFTQTTASCSQEALETEEEQKPQGASVSGRLNPFVTLHGLRSVHLDA